MEGSGGVVYAFGVGLANFGAGRSRLPRQVAADVREVLPLVAWYGATGNLALAAGECVDVAQRLAEITGTAWAVIPAGDLRLPARSRVGPLASLPSYPVPWRFVYRSVYTLVIIGAAGLRDYRSR